MAVPLIVASALLPVLTAARGRAALGLGGAASALLGVLAAAMNPACAPFAAFALLVGFGIFVKRAGRSAVAFLGVIALAAALVLANDPYYVHTLTLRLAPARPASPPTAQAPAPPAPDAAPPAAAERPPFPAAEIFLLAPNWTATGAGEAGDVGAWAGRRPYAALPPLAMAAVAVALVLARRRRSSLPPGAAPLVRLAVGCAAVWLVAKPLFLTLAWATTGGTGEAALLGPYVGFLLLRCELVLLFAAAAAAGSLLFLLAGGLALGARLFARLAAGLAAAALVAWLVWGGRAPCGDLVMTTSGAFVTTPDDFALAAWCDAHLPPEGRLGMAAATGRAGVRDEEQHLTGLDGMPAFLLRGRRGHYCFTLTSLESAPWLRGYAAHVKDSFDPRWCRENEVRYFYAAPLGLSVNPGLAAAVRDGRLRPLHREGSSCVYEVTEEAAP